MFAPVIGAAYTMTTKREAHWSEQTKAQITKKGMYVGLKQPHGDGKRYVTPARAAAKETSVGHEMVDNQHGTWCRVGYCRTTSYSASASEIIISLKRPQNMYLLLTEFEGRTVSYGSSFFPPRFRAHARNARAINRRGKNEDP